MKFWKAFGGFLCFIGCLAALAGILATALPMIDNDQIRRIIQSFSVKSQDGILNMVNGAILFCLHNNYWLFGGGAALLLCGGLMKTAAGNALYNANHTEQKSTVPVQRRASTSDPAQTKGSLQATVPILSNRAKAGISPYTAAEYGKALTSTGSQTSDIAKKYLPRSIIPAQDEPEEPFVWPPVKPEATLHGTDSAKASQAVIAPMAAPFTTENAERTGVILCLACGAGNPVSLSFCGQCGSKLPAQLTALATEAKQKAKDSLDREAYQKQPEQRNIYAEMSQAATAGDAKRVAMAKQEVESIFSVPVEPIATNHAVTREPLSGINELLTGNEWGKNAADTTARAMERRFENALPRQGDTVEERFQPTALEDIRLSDEWKRHQEADYSTAVKTARAATPGKPAIEDTKIKFVSRRFHPPVTESNAYNAPAQALAYVVPGKAASAATETIAATTAAVSATSGAADGTAQRRVMPAPTTAVTPTASRTLRPLSRARIISTIHSGAFENIPPAEPVVTERYTSPVPVSTPELDASANKPVPSPSFASVNPVPPLSNKPRIVSTMGKKSTL